MSHWPIEEIHISEVRVGDVVVHEGKERTVCANNLKSDLFFDKLLFGDSYHIGRKPVQRLKIERALPKIYNSN